MKDDKNNNKAKKVKYLSNHNLMKHFHLSVEQNKMTDELAKMLMMIVDNYAKRVNWSGYSYVDELKDEAIFQLCRGWHMFKPDRQKYPNPFAYFTQIISNAFLQQLKREKKHAFIRDVLKVESGLDASFGFIEKNKKDTNE